MNNSGGPLDYQTWQTEWKTAPLSKVQLCENENQTLEAFVADRRSYVKLIVLWPARISQPLRMTVKLTYSLLLSNSLSNVQTTHSNVQITSTNIQRYCAVQNRFFNRFGETMATARHENFWINYCSVSWRNLIDRLFFQPIKILHLTRHAPRVMPRVSRAFFLFRYVYKLHNRNSWIIINLLDIWACSMAVYFYSSFVFWQILHDS